MIFARREFLGGALVAPAVLGAACAGRVVAPAGTRTAVVDTHLHCFAGKGDTRFPYHPRAPYVPHSVATPEHLLRCMETTGVDVAVVVHPEPYQDDHRYLEHCLAVGGKRLRGTCLFFADKSNWRSEMAALARRVPIVALRIHATPGRALPPFGKPELRALWKQAADLGMAVQLHFFPEHAPGFEPLIQEFRDTKVIIDHMGRPLQGTPEQHAVVVRWSRFDNTIMKLCNYQPEARPGPHDRDLRPIVAQLLGAYGADRMMYGGGFLPGCTPESYLAYRELGRSLLPPLNRDDQAKIFGGVAARLFGLG